MKSLEQTEDSIWLSLGTARHLLEVNEATLRKWADAGAFRTYRTPGGHRRFHRGDILALAQSSSREDPRESAQTWEEWALQRIRRRLHRESTSAQDWYQDIDETSKSRLRLFGRQLLALAREHMSYPSRRKRLMEEAHFLGLEYGSEMARQKVNLQNAVQAFLFFRNSLMSHSSNKSLGETASSATDSLLAWQAVNQIADGVLTSIITAYQDLIDSEPIIKAANQ